MSVINSAAEATLCRFCEEKDEEKDKEEEKTSIHVL